MPSSKSLHSPVEWPATGLTLREKASIVLLGGIGCLAVLIGVVGGLDGRPIAFRYGLGYGCLVLLVVFLSVLLRRPCHRNGDIRTASTESGSVTEIRQSRPLWGTVIVLMACCTGLTAGASIEIYVNRSGTGVPGAAVAIGVLGLLFASSLLAVGLGLLRRGHVRLSPEGVRQRGWAFESYLPWDAIAGVKPAYNGHRMVLLIGYANATWARRYTTPIWRLDKLPPVPMIELDCRKFAIDDVALCHLVEFYASNPALRAELGTEASLARFRARDYQ
ncbi:hypothetical protein GS467_13990 [Rhodococcus hoagii]|nr:hypothetical protein [Prescottella equi]